MKKRWKITTPFFFFILSFTLAGSSIFVSSGAFALAHVHIERIQLYNGNIKISALLFTPTMREDTEQRPAILAFHGWGGSKENLIPTILGLAEAGYLVLAPDLRGHGESQGLADLGFLDQQDARVAIDYLVSRTDLVNTSALATWGTSFGGVISLIVAGTDSRITATVASSTPANISAWLSERDFRWQERVTFRPHILIDPDNSTALALRNPMSYLSNISNLLILHGERDAIVPVQQAIDLFANVPTSNKRLVVYPTQGHNLDAGAVKRETTQFLKTVFQHPDTKILDSTIPYYLIIFSWAFLLFGGMSILFGILSVFPTVHGLISNQTKPRTEGLQFNGSIGLLTGLLIAYIGARGGSILVSLFIPTYYSTILAITFGTITTGGIILVGFALMHTPSQLVFGNLDRGQLKTMALKVIFAVVVIFSFYLGFLLFMDHPWIPFINLPTALGLSSVFITIVLVLGIDTVFFWEIMYQLTRGIWPSSSRLQLYLLHSLIYFLVKIAVFFSLIFLFYSSLLEITLILYSLIIFGLLALFSPLVRKYWGLSATAVFNMLAGFVAYSTFSIFFLVI